jgi:imidazolonepropionase
MQTVDLIIKNASELITLYGPTAPRTKKQMRNIGIIKNGSIAIKDGIIVGVGKELNFKSNKIIDAKGKTVMPGFVDPHTHLVFSGTREFELDMKLKGATYMEILKAGGGIIYTVKKTKKANPNELYTESKTRLDNMLLHGTTTCEAKSGYGLDTETELKILKVNKKLNDAHPVDILSTFLGAHAVPKDTTTEKYTEMVIQEMMPRAAEYAKFCDVFCEKGVFTPVQSKKILLAAKNHGMIPKIHADEIVDTGGAGIAAEVGAISADHLLRANNKGLKQMAEKKVIGVMLPGTPFSLMMKEYANARKMINLGIPIALATDLNPNCYV